MKKILIIIACALAALTIIPSSDAAYQRTIMGWDSRGNPIIRVIWVADHLEYPRVYFDRRTYPTNGRLDRSSASASAAYTYHYR